MNVVQYNHQIICNDTFYRTNTFSFLNRLCSIQTKLKLVYNQPIYFVLTFNSVADILNQSASREPLCKIITHDTSNVCDRHGHRCEILYILLCRCRTLYTFMEWMLIISNIQNKIINILKFDSDLEFKKAVE